MTTFLLFSWFGCTSTSPSNDSNVDTGAETDTSVDSETPDTDDTGPADTDDDPGMFSIDNVLAEDGIHDSSTQLAVHWTGTADHVVATATDSQGSSWSVQSTVSPAIFTDLFSDTEYTVSVVVCADPECTGSTPLGEETASTPEEVWHFQGTGHSVATLSTVIDDGNAKVWGIWYGDDAPEEQAGRVQLYYGPTQGNGVNGQAVGVGTAAQAADASELQTLFPLTSHHGTAGVISHSPTTSLIAAIMTAQAIPLADEHLRLYFEANGNDGRTRILSIDGVDGFTGLDFNSGASDVCSSNADYQDGGGCEPTVVLGADGDSEHPVEHVPNVRQFKIGYPTLDHWAWDESIGTFLFFTIDGGGDCQYTGFANQAYAIWDGTTWNPVLREDGCPVALESVQAPAPVHLGESRYKLYHGDPSDRTGANEQSMLPFLGPKQLLYGDGARSDAENTLEWADWDARETARDLQFLWPDGTELTPGEEGYLDDFVFMTPTGTPDFQVAYIVLTDGSLVPRPALAVLMNP